MKGDLEVEMKDILLHEQMKYAYITVATLIQTALQAMAEHWDWRNRYKTASRWA
jgi:hypothetical protein